MTGIFSYSGVLAPELSHKKIGPARAASRGTTSAPDGCVV